MSRVWIVALCVACAAIAFYGALPEVVPPTPVPDGAVSLRGCFVGPDAAQDAATVAALCDGIADAIQFDGERGDPILRTGAAFDVLRTRARDLHCRGMSLGQKHPRARDAIKEFLDEAVGVSGGPITPAQRAAWVSAYREIARGAERAIK